MAEKRVTEQDRRCIAGCIFRYYGGNDASTNDEQRNRAYETCLDNCRVCS